MEGKCKWVLPKNMLSSSLVEQGSFISKSTIKCLFWNANDSIVKLMVSVITGVSLWYRPRYKNMLNYDNDN